MFENYLARKNLPHQLFYSAEIIVEGISYKLIFYANENGTAVGKYITVGI